MKHFYQKKPSLTNKSLFKQPLIRSITAIQFNIDTPSAHQSAFILRKIQKNCKI